MCGRTSRTTAPVAHNPLAHGRLAPAGTRNIAAHASLYGTAPSFRHKAPLWQSGVGREGATSVLVVRGRRTTSGRISRDAHRPAGAPSWPLALVRLPPRVDDGHPEERGLPREPRRLPATPWGGCRRGAPLREGTRPGEQGAAPPWVRAWSHARDAVHQRGAPRRGRAALQADRGRAREQGRLPRAEDQRRAPAPATLARRPPPRVGSRARRTAAWPRGHVPERRQDGRPPREPRAHHAPGAHAAQLGAQPPRAAPADDPAARRPHSEAQPEIEDS